MRDDAVAYRMLGASHISRGQLDKETAECGAHSAKYPDDLSVQRTYIQLLILNNGLDDAAARTAAILKKTPQDAEALVLKGEILLRQHKPDEALTTLQAALNSAPANAIGHAQVGL